MLLLALSCFQGRTQDAAFDAVRVHGVDGVQLTPGNLPSPDFRERIAEYGGTVRLHHRFAWDRYRREVYDERAQPVGILRDQSVHPPRTDDPRVPDARRWLEGAVARDLLLETMYPGYLLGSGAELELAMDVGARLAVDVSHLHLQRHAGVLADATVRRVLGYARVEEVHVSNNDGRGDQHAPLDAATPYLGWARERLGDLPVVVESYWHRIPLDDQRRQLDLLRRGA